MSHNVGQVGIGMPFCDSGGCSGALPGGLWKVTLISYGDVQVSGQVAEDAGLRPGLMALQVRVLDAEDQAPARLASDEPVEQRRANVAQVQQTGGRRCKTQPWPTDPGRHRRTKAVA